MSKYVLANVEVPIQINIDGSIETLQSYAKIHIIRQLSSPDDLKTVTLPVQEQIDNLFTTTSTEDTSLEKEEIIHTEETERDRKTTDEVLTILKSEMKSGSRPPIKNTSFKSKKVFKHNRTAKAYG